MRTPHADEFAALFAQAVHHHLRGRVAEALALYEAAIRLNPDVAAAHCNCGLALQALSRIDDALRSYDRAIALQGDYADAHYNRAVALRQLNRLEDAVQSYDRAIGLNPAHAEAHGNKANALRDLGRPDEALQSLDRAISLKPDFVQAHYNRGNVLQDLKRTREALESYDQALGFRPDLAEAHHNRANALRDLGRCEEAVHGYDRAILLHPGLAEAYYNRGNALQALGLLNQAVESYDGAIERDPAHAAAHNNRASALRKLGRPDAALRSCSRAVALRPGVAELHCNLGNVLQDLKRHAAAVECYDRAIAIEPRYAEAHSNRGNALRVLGRPDEALRSCEIAIILNPLLAEAHNNRGFALQQLKRLDKAVQSYDEAIRLRPGFADAHWNKAICALLAGDFETGWPLYEWRKRKTEPLGAADYPQPAWLGNERLDGRTLLVHAEQGLGDTIQFCRYAALAAERGAKVVLAVQRGLVRLLQGIGPAIEVVDLESGFRDFDYHAALLSLPLLFGTDETNIPARVPYLFAEPDRIRQWREKLGENGFKIGICWQGNPRGEIDIGRSFPVRHFEALAKVPAVRLISLQKYDGDRQLGELPAGVRVENLGDAFDAGPDPFLDTAAVMESLDLIITSDTAVAHLAGALGRPAWVALQYVPDWRWLLGRSDSPWYPTIRLFRQSQRGDWAGVFKEMAQALRTHARFA
ncbi:MAG TPA: tetratricopeptide repeat protein [Rhizomicrobium sp.]|jgi:tetratricopeptide (TPR) repeat protein|nr:tetratricopeptide repeat protein [Rhizomicrobium sp.]